MMLGCVLLDTDIEKKPVKSVNQFPSYRSGCARIESGCSEDNSIKSKKYSRRYLHRKSSLSRLRHETLFKAINLLVHMYKN